MSGSGSGSERRRESLFDLRGLREELEKKAGRSARKKARREDKGLTGGEAAGFSAGGVGEEGGGEEVVTAALTRAAASKIPSKLLTPEAEEDSEYSKSRDAAEETKD